MDLRDIREVVSNEAINSPSFSIKDRREAQGQKENMDSCCRTGMPLHYKEARREVPLVPVLIFHKNNVIILFKI